MEKLKIKIKKLHSEAVIPKYSKLGDAGMDLTAIFKIENTSFSCSYGTGLSIEIPEGYVGLLFPRSSIKDKDIILSNCVGVIDSGYRGEIMFKFRPINGIEDAFIYAVGDRVGQLIIIPYPSIEFVETEELSDSDRGDGGFGSTGK
jgi:dUTP pyrophosphatase